MEEGDHISMKIIFSLIRKIHIFKKVLTPESVTVSFTYVLEKSSMYSHYEGYLKMLVEK